MNLIKLTEFTIRISIRPDPSVFPTTLPKLHDPVGTHIQELVGVTIAGVITCRSDSKGPGPAGMGAGGVPLSTGKLKARTPFCKSTAQDMRTVSLPFINIVELQSFLFTLELLFALYWSTIYTDQIITSHLQFIFIQRCPKKTRWSVFRRFYSRSSAKNLVIEFAWAALDTNNGIGMRSSNKWWALEKLNPILLQSFDYFRTNNDGFTIVNNLFIPSI